MIARLWWKEARTILPAWLALIGAGAGLQIVLLASGTEGIRSGFLLIAALCWATLYAFLVASAAFAGERETGSLGLLDALPVDRRTLWLGKATFALASTLGLALAMLALGCLGSTELTGIFSVAIHLGWFATVLFEAVAWGLFWSALLPNPMVAGALAVCTVGLIATMASPSGVIGEFVVDRVIPERLGMATLALVASAGAITWGPRAGWSIRTRDAAEDDPRDDRSRPIRPQPATPTRVLLWKAMREGFGTWLGASLVGWIALAWVLAMGSNSVGGLAAFPALGAALVAGVGVFGGQTASGSQRFLLHLGVAPGQVWARTMRAWGNGLAVTLAVLLAIVSFRELGWWHAFSDPTLFLQLVDAVSVPGFAAIVDAFAIGMLAGMVFRRRLTAGLIAVMAWLGVVPLQYGLAVTAMMSPWALLLTPAALIAISRAWAGDWLDDRPGPARWLRLSGLVALPSALLATAFIASRAWGVPDPGPVAASIPAPLAATSGSAEVYRRLYAELPPKGKIQVGFARAGVSLVGALRFLDVRELSQEWFRGVHRAAELPPFRHGGGSLFGNVPDLDGAFQEIAWCALLLDLHGRTILDQGNLAEAWADVLAQYRIARQMTGVLPDSAATRSALQSDRRATLLALEWADGDGQTPDLLRKALADLRALPAFPALGDVLTADAPALERALNLPAAELEAEIYGSRRRAIHTRVFESLLLFPAWERERARRVCRAEFKALISASEDETRPIPPMRTTGREQDIRRTSPLAAMLMANWSLTETLNRAEVGRRGAAQIIALRCWSLEHQGTYPESLDALAPGLLDRLPPDPYSGRPFVYARAEGSLIPRLNLETWQVGDGFRSQPDQRLLISVGPNGRREAGQGPDVWPDNDDLVFPLP